jgi:glucose dehydrogenase
MVRKTFFISFIVWLGCSVAGSPQVNNFTEVTQQMLENPSPNDWLMFSRTYDAQRFSPLEQINRQTP